MFEIGQWVMYGIHGVCRIAGTEKQLVNRKRSEFLVLEPLSKAESKFYLPLGNPTALAKLKPVLSVEELRALLNSPEVREDHWIEEESRRKMYYKDLITRGDRKEILQTICALYRYKAAQMEAGKKFHLCDDNFLRDAEKLMSSEIALVLEMTMEQARDYLRTEFAA